MIAMYSVSLYERPHREPENHKDFTKKSTGNTHASPESMTGR